MALAPWAIVTRPDGWRGTADGVLDVALPMSQAAGLVLLLYLFSLFSRGSERTPADAETLSQKPDTRVAYVVVGIHSAVAVLAILAAGLTFRNTSLAAAAGIASFLLAWNGPKLLQYFSNRWE